jgi:serine/threonine-protein kinase PpkA
MKATRRRLGLLGVSIGLLATLPRGVRAQGRTPLLMPGKKTLFQRVLVRPGAIIVDKPGATASSATPRPFDLFYVFERRTSGAAEWLLVGSRPIGPTVGWLPAEKCLAWKQTIVVQFTNSAGRERSLLFRDSAVIGRFLSDPSDLPALRTRAQQHALRPDDRVVAIEPEDEVDKRNAFYLLPILDYQMITQGAKEVQALHVACVAETEPPPIPPKKVFRSGIVFVMDTTISMRPYIERTHEAIRLIYQRMRNSSVGKNLSFGLVGYRNSIEKTPGLEYLTKIYVPLETDQNPDVVLATLSTVKEARVSSHDLRDDLYSGIKTAIEELDWGPFDGRYIVFVTDGGPLPASDRWSQHLEPTTLNNHAGALNISITGLNLITPPNRSIYPASIPAMQILCGGFASDKTPRYFQVPNGSEVAFAQAAQRLTGTMASGLEAAAGDKLVQPELATDDLTRKTLVDTLAMQLAYLGRQSGEQAPDVIDGWLADRALEDIDLQAVNVCVLMSKNELSTLKKVLEQIIDEGEQTRDDSPRFFDRIRAALAKMARDPNQLNESDRLVNTNARTLGEAMGELLQDLPYKSEVQDITNDDWVSKSRADQREILDRLKSKVHYFDEIYAAPNLWTALYSAAPPGETVYPMPLSSLP